MKNKFNILPMGKVDMLPNKPGLAEWDISEVPELDAYLFESPSVKPEVIRGLFTTAVMDGVQLEDAVRRGYADNFGKVEFRGQGLDALVVSFGETALKLFKNMERGVKAEDGRHGIGAVAVNLALHEGLKIAEQNNMIWGGRYTLKAPRQLAALVPKDLNYARTRPVHAMEKIIERTAGDSDRYSLPYDSIYHEVLEAVGFNPSNVQHDNHPGNTILSGTSEKPSLYKLDSMSGRSDKVKRAIIGTLH